MKLSFFKRTHKPTTTTLEDTRKKFFLNSVHYFKEEYRRAVEKHESVSKHSSSVEENIIAYEHMLSAQRQYTTVLACAKESGYVTSIEEIYA